MPSIQVFPIPALTDNYIWIIRYENNAIVIDPAESEHVLAYLAKYQLNLKAILLTHNHKDHIDGVPAIIAQYPNTPVYGSIEVKPLYTTLVEGGSHFEIDGLNFDVIASAGHTAHHVSFLLNREMLFSGDSLFSGGCGRVFTGDYQALFTAFQHFKALPDFVEIYPAHEYTQNNLKFAETVIPTSCAFLEYQERVDILRSQGKPTLPTTIEREKQINPFMQAVNLDEFIALRQQKDNF